jgi:hypothetical protein
VNGRPMARVVRKMVPLAALLPLAAPTFAGEPITAMAPPHGPMLMFYVSQPLWTRGASRIYGLRLDQIAIQPFVQSGTFSAIAQPRSLVDLQLRRNADVRVEFGHRVTWDVRRREFDLSGYQHGMSAELIAIPR